MGARSHAGIENLLQGGVFVGIAHIFQNRSGEKVGILRNDRDAVPQVFERQVLQIHSVQQYAPFRRVVKANQKIGEGAFSCSRFSDDAQGLSGGQIEGYIFQNRMSHRVGESDIFKGHPSGNGFGGKGLGTFHNLRLGIHDFDQPAHGIHAVCRHGNHVHKEEQR